MPRHPSSRCNLTWEQIFGTSASNNLSQYKRNTCIEETVDIETVQIKAPWVSLNDFHYYHIKCPYSTEASIHTVRSDDGDSWQYTDVSSEADTHTSTSGIMIRYNRGSKYGYLCVDPNCPYYKGTVSGTEGGSWYFYV